MYVYTKPLRIESKGSSSAGNSHFGDAAELALPPDYASLQVPCLKIGYLMPMPNCVSVLLFITDGPVIVAFTQVGCRQCLLSAASSQVKVHFTTHALRPFKGY